MQGTEQKGGKELFGMMKTLDISIVTVVVVAKSSTQLSSSSKHILKIGKCYMQIVSEIKLFLIDKRSKFKYLKFKQLVNRQLR